MATIMNEIVPNEGTTIPSRTRNISQVAVIGNIIRNHVPDVFNISNDVWLTFNYQVSHNFYCIKDIQRQGVQGRGGGRLHSQRGKGGCGGRYNINRNNWRGRVGYRRGGRVN